MVVAKTKTKVKAKTKVKGKGKTAKKSPKRPPIDKGFLMALKNLEEMAMGQISDSGDPFKTGIRIVEEIKKMTTRLEEEIDFDSRELTEAYGSDPGIVGVGVGVF